MNGSPTALQAGGTLGEEGHPQALGAVRLIEGSAQAEWIKVVAERTFRVFCHQHRETDEPINRLLNRAGVAGRRVSKQQLRARTASPDVTTLPFIRRCDRLSAQMTIFWLSNDQRTVGGSLSGSIGDGSSNDRSSNGGLGRLNRTRDAHDVSWH